LPPPLPLSDIKGPAALTPRKRARAHIVFGGVRAQSPFQFGNKAFRQALGGVCRWGSLQIKRF